MTNGPKQFDLSRPIALTCRFILRLEVKRAHLKIEKRRLETNSHLTLWLFAYSNFHTESDRQIGSDGNLRDWGMGTIFTL